MIRRRPGQILGYLLAALLLTATGANADERILSFHSDIDVQADGSMFVTETIRVRAEGGQIKRGIYRDFPTTYTTRAGDNYVVDFEVLKVTRDGAPESYFTESRGNGVRVYIGKQSVLLPAGEYTYGLNYHTKRQLGFFETHDELYWNVTGLDWAFPMDMVTARVILPATVPGHEVKLEAFTGPAGSTGRDYTGKVNELDEARFRTTRGLAPGEGLTIVVAWPKGHVHAPSAWEKFRYFLADNQALLIGLIGMMLVVLYYVMAWIKVGRDPQRGTIVPLFEPPEGLSPAAIRYIHRMGYDNKAFSAAIINLAVKGYLTITDSDDTYRLEKTKDADDAVLNAREKKIVEKLFRGGQSIVFEKSNSARIRDAIRQLKSMLKKEYQAEYFKTNGWYLIPGALASLVVLFVSGAAHGEHGAQMVMMSVWLAGWTFTLFVLIRQRNYMLALVFGFFELSAIGALIGMGSWSLLGLICVLIGLNILFFYLMKAPTDSGRRLMDRIEGFKMYLSTAEEDRLNVLNRPQRTPELFEKYLPYALALGVDQAWSERFDAVLAAESRAPGSRRYRPSWYRGASWNDFNARGFSSSLGSSLSKAIAASATPPGSRSGGGFSGGGSSGGGGGGGGGGGW